MFYSKVPKTLLVTLATLLCASSLVTAAPKKDRDAKRVRARRAPINKVIKDKVGQNDLRDWRFVEVPKSVTLEILVRFEAKDGIELVVTNASGKVLKKEVKGDGVRKISLKTTPGIYYIMVEAKDAPSIAYDMTLKTM